MQKRSDQKVFIHRIRYYYVLPVLFIFIFSSVLMLANVNTFDGLEQLE
jgi:hypothetical protein